ncbi:MAG TPA: SprT family zinc-dependent metalloprotease [Woeseiaceae bacterium]|nr:SprT family zinc-dependent metalloprotease [Woeseiaceae bacterium]
MQITARQIPLFPPDQPVPDRPGIAPGLSVRESARARHLSIKVYPRGRVEVIVPRRTGAAEVQRFVAENRDWISRARESFACRHDQESDDLPSRIDLPAVGRSIRVQYLADDRADRGKVRYRQAGTVLTLRGNTANHGLCVTAIKRWLAELARQEFASQLLALSQLSGNAYDSMHIRAQRTCWGSRSSSGTISLNVCLLFLRPAVVRYLMLHELCHGRHMNHSKRFWKLVGQFEPDYRQLDRELEECWREVPGWMGLY